MLIGIWIVIYMNLKPLTDWLVDDLLKLTAGKHLTEALRFFIFEVPKVLMLLVLIIFAVGIIRSFFTPERTRRALEGKSLFTGNVLASILGSSPLSAPVLPFLFSSDSWNPAFRSVSRSHFLSQRR